MTDLATPQRAGTMGDDCELVAVTFDSSPKHYYYWVPREWQVHVGDQLVVCTPSTPRAIVRIVDLGRPPDKTGQFHKTARSIYRRHTDRNAPRTVADMGFSKLEDRATLHGMDASGYKDSLLADWKIEPNLYHHAKGQLEAYRQKLDFKETATGRTSGTAPDQSNIPKESTMIEVKSVTYLNGKPFENCTDDELFAAIRKDEAEINDLLKIENKPKALKDRITKLEAGIKALVAMMDARP